MGNFECSMTLPLDPDGVRYKLGKVGDAGYWEEV